MNTDPKPTRRWYDGPSDTTKFIETLSAFPEDAQSVICVSITRLADTQFHAHELLDQAKTLGADQVMALYQAKQKRRHYDKNPYVHTTMNYGTALPEEQRNMLMGKAIGVIRITLEYFSLCNKFRTLPELPVISRLAEESIHKGDAVAHASLGEMRAIFLRSKGHKTNAAMEDKTAKTKNAQALIDEDRIYGDTPPPPT
jgi:hypothetical protein